MCKNATGYSFGYKKTGGFLSLLPCLMTLHLGPKDPGLPTLTQIEMSNQLILECTNLKLIDVKSLLIVLLLIHIDAYYPSFNMLTK